MKAQASIEYLMIVGVLLLIVIPIFYYSSNRVNANIKLEQVDDAVKNLVNAANDVYSLGPGAKKYITITVPDGIKNITIDGKDIIFNLGIFGDVSVIHLSAIPNVTGYILSSKGTYIIPVETLSSGIVLIGNTSTACGNLICDFSESCSICPSDCGACVCGNNICEAVETCNTCPSDCGVCEFCGDSICNLNENCSTCPSDCGECNGTEFYGNNICDEGETNTDCPANCPPEEGKALLDRGIDIGWYFKTDGSGLLTKDSGMKALDDITVDLLDDNVNTPSTTFVIRTKLTGGKNYEGFIVKDNTDANNYGKIVLYGRVRIIDVDPFKLRVFSYQSDGDTANTNNFTDFSISKSILQQKVKWVELDVTDIAHLEDGFGFIKLRVTALEDSNQDNQRFQFSELHIKVEEL